MWLVIGNDKCRNVESFISVHVVNAEERLGMKESVLPLQCSLVTF